jgi:hypothetical protein
MVELLIGEFVVCRLLSVVFILCLISNNLMSFLGAVNFKSLLNICCGCP